MSQRLETYKRLFALCKRMHSNYDGELGRNLSSHLPMCLTALLEMGADAADMEKFYESYTSARNIPPLIEPTLPADFDWRAHLGDISLVPQYARYFKREIFESNKSVDGVLREYLPTLLKGFEAQLFHAPIRLFFALKTQDKEEIAIALGFFAAFNNPLPLINERNLTTKSVETILRQLCEKTDWKFDRTTQLKQIPTMPDFQEIVQTPSCLVDATDVSKIAPILIRLYAETEGFFQLHLVTGCHALRSLLQFVENKSEIILHYFQLVCAFSARRRKIGKPVNFELESLKDWPELFKEAVKNDDDHKIKLVHCCFEETQVYKDPIYKYVANRVLQIEGAIVP